MLYLLPLLLAMLLTVLALRRSDTRRRGLRVAAGLLAAAGLALAAWPPARLRPGAAPGAAMAVLLTPGYSPDTLAALLSNLGPSTPVWRFAPLETRSTPADTPSFRNASAIRAARPGLHRLHVLGQGLPAADVPALAGLELRTYADAPATGFGQAAWETWPTLGEAWAVSGLFTPPAGGPVWLRLRAAGAVRDSVRLPGGTGTFRLSFMPRAVGRAVYTLEASGSGWLLREPVPIDVRAPAPLRVLLLAATPSFELRFLKDYLAGRQYAVALRIGLSRGLTQTEFLNLPNQLALGSLSSALLARFDVVVTDAATLASFGGAETAALRTAIANGTAGLLLLADSPTLPRQLPGGAAFGLQPRPASAAAAALALRWPGAAAQTAALVPATLRPTAGLRALISSEPAGQLVAASRRLGLGTVVVSTVIETFPWQLRGQPAVYGAYWSRLLGAARPPRPAALSIAPLSRWPRPNSPLELRVTGDGASGPLTITGPDGPTVAATRPDARVPEWSSATYWPAAAGWHEAQMGAARHWFYVYGPRQWRGPEQSRWRLAAARTATAPVVAATIATVMPLEAPTRETWPRWWGYVLFLLGAGLLWLEEKL